MSQELGTVYLVGAGCGDADLITVRGQKLLQQCDTLVYDDLIAGSLVQEAPPSAERIYMGKRCGKHSAHQEEICAVLIQKAREGKRVVRLKGGDPFVFGRGGEEACALQEAGIPFQVVPGVTSAVAIPGLAGIPVTYRGLSRSVHIITAHAAHTPDGLPPELDQLAKLPGTLVFLMGLSQLEKIAVRLIQAGMDPKTPAAAVSGGNSPTPSTVRAPLDQLSQAVREAGLKAPAVIVVGQVAQFDFV